MENFGKYPRTVAPEHHRGWIVGKLRDGQVMCNVCRQPRTGVGAREQRMWVAATAPTSSHNETLFFCLTGPFL